MLEWLKRKAIQKSEANIRELVAELIRVSNQAFYNIRRTHGPNPADQQAVHKLQTELGIQLCGPIPLEEVRARFIDPALSAPDVTEGARMAVLHAYESVSKELK